jgi:SAM-dependent methyltransferase
MTMKRVALGLTAVFVVAAVTMPRWKPAAKRFKWFVVSTNLYQDALRRVGVKKDQISQPDWAALPESSLETYLGRIEATYRNYQKYGDLAGEEIRSAHILEIGPGETLGVALRLVAAGAAQVTAVDKFVPLQTSAFHRRLYGSLMDRLPADERHNLGDTVDLRDGVRFNQQRVSYVYGQGIEDACTQFAPHSFDAVVSNAVLEEVYDLDRLFDAVDRVVKPGGRQIHVIDLRDYGMFTKYGFHPLEFLTIPDGIYRYMVESTGQPNRRLVDYYRSKVASLGYTAQIYTTWVLGQNEPLTEYRTRLRHGSDYSDEALQLVQSIRPRLLARYQRLSDEDLITQSILLVARKPVPAETRAAN